MKHESTTFDVAIIGSGIGGSSLAAILARQGLKVVVFEGGSHPRFAVGESMILETSEVLRALAEFYDVPELAYFSSENFFAHIGTSHGVKRHFSYLHHTAGQPYLPLHTLQAVIPKQPHGHELHLYRQDTDYFLTSVAVAYGATVLQNTRIKDIIVGDDGVEIMPEQGDSYHANYVVDAGGFRSILATKYGLRDTSMQTHSRSIFTHMVNVPDYNDVGPSREQYGLPFRLGEGTLHHIFKGGWMWVIPFNNHARATNPLISVGLQLDPRLYPTRKDVSPEEEFFDFVEQFPGMRAQFAGARAVRGWVRTERIQYTATRVIGDRFCLLGHAAGFVDPLYSKGLYTTMMSIGVLADLLLKAQPTGDYSAAQFQPLEQLTQGFVRTNDRLVANSFKSFGNPRLWQVYSVLWMLGAYLEFVKLSSERGQASDRADYFRRVGGLKLAGGGFGEFAQLADQVDTIVEATDPDDQHAVDRAASEIRALYAAVEWMPEAFTAVLAGKNHLPAQKLRLSLLKPGDGFFGKGAYRQHFFGTRSLPEAARFFALEKARYGRLTLDMQHRRRVAARASGVK